MYIVKTRKAGKKNWKVCSFGRTNPNANGVIIKKKRYADFYADHLRSMGSDAVVVKVK